MDAIAVLSNSQKSAHTEETDNYAKAFRDTLYTESEHYCDEK
jgi:hypothetical protein